MIRKKWGQSTCRGEAIGIASIMLINWSFSDTILFRIVSATLSAMPLMRCLLNEVLELLVDDLFTGTVQSLPAYKHICPGLQP